MVLKLSNHQDADDFSKLKKVRKTLSFFLSDIIQFNKKNRFNIWKALFNVDSILKCLQVVNLTMIWKLIRYFTTMNQSLQINSWIEGTDFVLYARNSSSVLLSTALNSVFARKVSKAVFFSKKNLIMFLLNFYKVFKEIDGKSRVCKSWAVSICLICNSFLNIL